MTARVDRGLDLKKARIRYPVPAPGDEWEGERPAASVRRQAVRRLRRRIRASLRSREH